MPGAIANAAIAALCTSGRQEAAEVLARLAPKDERAREALGAMGELAVPVLEQRAATDDLQAVDDLAFIGTPVAAEALARLMCIEEEVHPTLAAAAAWRFAELLAVPDVEEGLKNSGFQIPDGVPSYDWEWRPFAGSRVKAVGAASLSKIIGMRREAAEASFIAESRSMDTPSKRSTEYVDSILQKLELPQTHDSLMRGLPWPVLARPLAALFTHRMRTTNDLSGRIENVWNRSGHSGRYRSERRGPQSVV